MTTGLIPWTTWPFQATGAPTPRTQPNRLAEIKNVKDFGAVGDGGTDDTTAILNAVNWTTGPNRGTIFFPPGFYTCKQPITLNYNPSPGQPGLSIHFLGEGGVSFLNTTGQTYSIDRSLGTPNNTAQIVIEKMQFGAGLRLGSCSSVVIRDSRAGLITTEDSPGNSSQNIFIESCLLNTLVMGGSGIVCGNDWVSADVAVRAYGKGFAFYGNRIEECNVAYMLGLDDGVVTTVTGSLSHTGTNDNSGLFTITSTVAGGTIKPWQELSDNVVNIPSGIFITGQVSGPAGGAPGVYNVTNPTVTVASQSVMLIGNDRGASGFCLHGGSTEGNWNGAVYAGTCTGFYHGSMGFLGHSNSGPSNNLPTQYHLVVGPNCSNGVFQGLYGLGDLAAVAGGYVYSAAARANLLFLAVTVSANGYPGGVDWVLPANAYTAQWMNSNVSPVWTFSQLPTGGNVLVGDQFVISDPNTNTWGANVTASGSSGQVLVRWNGSNWTVVGK